MTDIKKFKPFQYSMYWLLVVGLATAVFLGIVTPQLRQLPTYDVIRIGKVWGAAFTVGVGLVLLLFRSFRKACAAEGNPLCILYLAKTPWWVLPCASLPLIFPIYSLITFFTESQLSISGATATLGVETIVARSSAVAIPLVLFACFGAAVALPARCVLFYEHGFLHNTVFTTWNEVDCDQWRKNDGQLWIIRHGSRSRPLKLAVDDDDQMAVEEALEKVRAKYHGVG